jgi:hypothetical protein
VIIPPLESPHPGGSNGGQIINLSQFTYMNCYVWQRLLWDMISFVNVLKRVPQVANDKEREI